MSDDATRDDTREVERVLAANAAFYGAFNAQDADAIDALWANGHAVSCVHPNWHPVSTRTQVMDSFRMILRSPRQPRLVVGAAEVHLAGEVAVLTCRELAGGAPLAVTNVFVLEEGDWRLMHRHASVVGVKWSDGMPSD
ncbi:MAG: nuclear transport factor 2 family protein [Chloroflexi bacterium]|nr:nuclear transport factor 2 family protein [Chloroflexota bacterium]MDA1240494.1 nuclear transport factor 2 family protein [Chloroflexota bacterium]